MKKTGRILIAADLGNEYGFVDVDGKIWLLVLVCFVCHDFFFTPPIVWQALLKLWNWE